jgi:flagellar basal-body rod protein FlgC
MGMFDAFDVSASALTAERLRMDVTAENLANAQTTRTASGGAYKRKEVVLESIGGENSFGTQLSAAMGGNGGPAGGVKAAAIVEDASPGKRVYDPSHPDADKQGYVTMPNVDTVTEMVDLIGSSRAYEANVTALQDSKQMFSRTLDILR